ncbi:MAG: tetratricopeptide repeat protein [Myxococcales bacterium]
MPDEQEQRYLDLIQQFPDSPLGYFSLAKYYVDARRFDDAVPHLERCLAHDPSWAAALVALADAHAGAGRPEKAIAILEQAQKTALAQNHRTMADEIADRLDELQRGF